MENSETTRMGDFRLTRQYAPRCILLEPCPVCLEGFVAADYEDRCHELHFSCADCGWHGEFDLLAAPWDDPDAPEHLAARIIVRGFLHRRKMKHKGAETCPKEH